MLRKLVVWMALCACAVPALMLAQPASIAPFNPTQTVSAGGTGLLIAQVRDVSNNPVLNQVVLFQVSPSTPGIALSSAFAATDVYGNAQVTFTAPTVTGSYVVNASVYGLPIAQATFLIYVGGGTTPTPTGTGMQVLSGNGQIVSVLAPTTPRPLTVVVRDASGTRVPGVIVTWQVSSGTAGILTPTSYTDINGQAATLVAGNTAAFPGIPYQSATITASSVYGSVSFVVTALGLLPGGLPVSANAYLLSPTTDTVLTGKSGQTLPNAIQVQVITSSGLPIPNVGLEVTANTDPTVGPVASCATPNILTDANGGAKCDLFFGRTTGDGILTVNVGSVLVRNLNFSVTPGDPASIVVIQGDGQSGNAGQTLSQNLVAEVRDASGNPLQGVGVLWEFGTQGTGARLSSASQVSDSNGRVSAGVTLGTVPGDLIVRVRAGSNASVVATFTLHLTVAVAGIAKISGDNQTALTGRAFGSALVVEVRDAQTRPVPNQSVSFAVSGPATLSASSVTTDSQGRAQVTVQAGSTGGSITVTATAGGFSVTFNLTARLPGPTITAASFFNAASMQRGLVPGGITTIVGTGLATGLDGCLGSGTITGPLPLGLGGVEVLFGITSAPIYSVCNVNSQEQVTVQAPFDLAPGGAVYITVKVSGGQTTVSGVPVLVALPGIFETVAADGTRYGVATRPDGTLVTPSNSARRGEIVRFYATSLGPTLPLVQTNQPGVGGQLAYLPVIVGLAGSGVPVVSAEYAENMIGAFVIAFQIPDNAPTGREVTLSMGVVVAEGQPLAYSNTVKIAIQ